MEPTNSVRLIPSIFDKLFFYTTPADAVAYGNAHFIFGPIACRQVRFRLATPKNGMLLLAWPFCMHSREGVSSFYKQIEFYDVLRINILKSDAARRRKSAVADEKMRDFLTGFESFMLQCVLNNSNLYADLNILMLNFHGQDLYYLSDVHDRQGFSISLLSFQRSWMDWFLCRSTTEPATSSKNMNLRMNSELWGKVIDAVTIQCAPTLRHFVLASSFRLPADFYVSLKLDCMLSRLQQLETLYMPSISENEQAYQALDIERPCWKALHDMPIEKRLPSLQRIVIDSPKDQRTLTTDVFAIRDAFRSSANTTAPTSSADKLPQLYRLSPKLCIEIVDPSNYIKYHNARADALPTTTNFAWVLRDRAELAVTLSRSSRVLFANFDYLHFSFRKGGIQRFTSAFENLVLKMDESRAQTLTVIDDVKKYSDGSQPSSQLPVCLSAEVLSTFAPANAASLLKYVSCRCSRRPLSLTLHFDWEELIQQSALFVTNECNGTPQWMTCFPRGVLKLNVTIKNGLQQRPADGSDFMPFLAVDGSHYRFPPQVTIQFRPQALTLNYGQFDNTVPLVREYFTKCVQKFVSNELIDADCIPGIRAGKEEIARNMAFKTLRADLYASCRKLIVKIEVSCPRPPRELKNLETSDADRNAILQQVERDLHDKQFEQELLQLFSKIISVDDDEEKLQFIMPNLKSIVILRHVTVY